MVDVGLQGDEARGRESSLKNGGKEKTENRKADQTQDKRLLHGGMPVEEGKKREGEGGGWSVDSRGEADADPDDF